MLLFTRPLLTALLVLMFLAFGPPLLVLGPTTTMAQTLPAPGSNEPKFPGVSRTALPDFSKLNPEVNYIETVWTPPGNAMVAALSYSPIWAPNSPVFVRWRVPEKVSADYPDGWSYWMAFTDDKKIMKDPVTAESIEMTGDMNQLVVKVAPEGAPPVTKTYKRPNK